MEQHMVRKHRHVTADSVFFCLFRGFLNTDNTTELQVTPLAEREEDLAADLERAATRSWIILIPDVGGTTNTDGDGTGEGERLTDKLGTGLIRQRRRLRSGGASERTLDLRLDLNKTGSTGGGTGGTGSAGGAGGTAGLAGATGKAAGSEVHSWAKCPGWRQRRHRLRSGQSAAR